MSREYSDSRDIREDGVSEAGHALSWDANHFGLKLALAFFGLCLLPMMKTLHHNFERMSPASGLTLGLQVLPLVSFFWLRKTKVTEHPIVWLFASFVVCNAAAYLVDVYEFEVDYIISWIKAKAFGWLPFKKPYDPLTDLVNGFKGA